MRDVDSHRLSEAAAYLDRNKKLQLKAKRTVPQLADLASWAVRDFFLHILLEHADVTLFSLHVDQF